MSEAAAAAASTLDAPAHATARSWRLIALGAAIAFSIAWTLHGGRVFHWDAVNYHFYAGFSALNDRFAQDFFAAGTPSYNNPYAYVPLHWLVSSGMPAVIAVTLLAAVHGLMLWVTYEIAVVACGASRAAVTPAFALVALAFAALSPVFLQGVGLTLVDIPIGTVTLAGWLAIARSLRAGDLRLVALGGLLCGVAAGLKLSNTFYAVAAVSMVAFLPLPWRARIVAAVVCGIACAGGFLMVSAPWSASLWDTFGNPLFPFLNHWFASPDFLSTPLHYERFRPADAYEFLMRPVHMLSTLSRQHTEGRAPDLRYFFAFVLPVGWVAFAYLRRTFARAARSAAPLRDPVADRTLAALFTAFCVAWCLWLTASGNSRYFIAMSCIAAVLIAATLQRLHARRPDTTIVIALLLGVAQATQVVVASDWRRGGPAWDGPLLQTHVPDRFAREPYLFLSTSFLSASAFLPQFHPESAMVTTAGFYTIGPDRPGWARTRALIERNIDRVRIVRVLPRGVTEKSGLPGPASDLDNDVRRFGLRVDGTDCEFLKLRSSFLDPPLPRTADDDWTSFVTCRLVAAPERAEAYRRDVAAVDIVFDRVEDACPNLFHPRRPVTEQLPKWVRLYNMGSEMQLWIDGDRILYRSPLLGGDPIDAGSVAAWRAAPQPLDCSKRFVTAFGLKE